MPKLVDRHANVRAHGFAHECVGIVAKVGREQRFDRRPYTIDNGTQVRRLFLAAPSEFFERGENRAATRMSEHDHESCAIARSGEFDAADLRRRDDISGDANDEQIAQTLIKNDFGRNARIGASENDRKRFLRGSNFATARAVRRRIAAACFGDETTVAFEQPTF